MFPLFEASPSVFEFLKAKDNSQRVIVKDVTCHYYESLLCFGFDSLRIGLTFLTFNLEAVRGEFVNDAAEMLRRGWVSEFTSFITSE